MESPPAVDDRTYRLLVEAVVDYAIYLIDPDGHIRTWNAGAERLKGYTAAEILGKSFALFFTEEDRRKGLPGRALETARRLGRFESEGWRQRKDGTRFWALAVVDAVRDAEGQVVGFAKITRDVTERYEAQRALLETERRFRLLVESVTDYAIFMLHPDGTVANWNAGARRIKGYAADEIVGQHFSRFYTEEDRAAGVPRRALAEARSVGRFEAEGWRVRKDGTRFWASVVIDPVRDESGELIGFAKITRDLTERRAAQIALDEAREQLTQAQKLEALGQLTGGVAHDFNNLLQVISSGIAVAERIGGGDGKLGRILAQMRTATQRGAELTNQLLAFSRRAPLRPEVADAASCLQQAAGLLGRSLPPEVSFRTLLDDDLWPIRVDVGQLEVALLNLAVNARDAMPGGGTITLRARNTRLAGEVRGLSGPHVAISVADTGAGIPAEVLARVFEPFFTTKPVGKGTGLGLSQVHGFAEQAGGTATIRSVPGEGTEVTLFLPALPGAVPGEPEGDGASAGPATTRPPCKLRILVVDDDPAVGQITAEMLATAGYEPVTVHDPAVALKHLESGRHFDVMLSDVVMPGHMSGLMLAREARRRWPDLPILLASGYAGNEGVSPAEFPLLRKPFTALELTRTIMALPGAAAQPART